MEWDGEDDTHAFDDETIADAFPEVQELRQSRAMPPRKPPLASMLAGSRSFTAVKQELREPGGQSDAERQAKIRAVAERIRAEARQAREATAAEQTQNDRKQKAMDALKSRQQEEDDMRMAEGLLQAVEHKVAAAEEHVEQVSMVASPLAMEAVEEFKEMQLGAIRETEKAVRAALAVVATAQKEIDGRQAEVSSLSGAAKAKLDEELPKLAKRLEDAKAHVESQKNVRKDFEAAIAAEKCFSDLSQRMASVEIDCEKACMMAEPLAKALEINPDDMSFADVRETREALRLAQAALAPTMRMIANKAVGLKGPIRQKIMELTARAEAAQAALEKAQRTVEESQSRVALVPILGQVAERAAAVEEVLQMMRETESPFLMGIETMPADEATETLSKMDKAAALAQSALADAHKYIALKGVEVARFPERVAEAARRELEHVKQQVDEGFDRVRKFQADAAKRRRLHLVEGVKQKVEEAESAIARLREAGGQLQNGKLQNTAEMLEKAHGIELEAQNAVTIARRELQERQQDMRPLQSGPAEAQKNHSDILKTKVRVNYMEAELSKFRKFAQELEERIKVEKSLAEISVALQEVEEALGHLSERPDAEEAALNEFQGKLTDLNVKVESRLQKAQGVELKELRSLFQRLQKSQSALNIFKDSVREKSRYASQNILREVTSLVKRAEAKVAAVVGPSAKPASLTIERLEALNIEATAAMDLVTEAQRQLGKNQSPQLLMDAKVDLARLQLRIKASERKGKAAADALKTHLDQVAEESERVALDTLRAAARQADGTSAPAVLFSELSGSSAEISERQFCEFFERCGMEPQLSVCQVRLAFGRLAPYGFTKQAFLNALADILKVTREITITDEFPIHSAKKVRSLSIGELVEAQGPSEVDQSLGLVRLRIRALRDGITGWVTMRSSAGVVYLSRAAKPFLWCTVETVLRLADESSAQDSVVLRAGEVLELLEGPREEKLSSDSRVRGVTCQDERPGWLQVSNKNGDILAKINPNIFKCVEAIAMTDVPDFASCTMIRRVDCGEALELAEEAEVLPSEGGCRRKFRACRDGVEGWVTVKGSQGKVYVKAAQKHYQCLQAAPVHTGLSAESAVEKVLLPGEAFAAFEDPKEVAGGEIQSFFSVRSSGGHEGWVSTTGLQEVRPWSSRYLVLRAAQLTQAFAANEAAALIEVIRLLQPGEIVDIIEQPIEDTSTGQLRARCVTVAEKVAGWVTIQDSDGDSSLYLRPATEAEVAQDVAHQASARQLTTEVDVEPVHGVHRTALAASPQVKTEMRVKEEPEWGRYGLESARQTGGAASARRPVQPSAPPPKRFKGSGKHW